MHYLSQEPLEAAVNDRAVETAIACINACQNIIRIAREIKDELIAVGHWFAIYSIFFAVFPLAYFVLENPSDERAPAILEDAKHGLELLIFLREYSLVARRCSVSLQVGELQHVPL